MADASVARRNMVESQIRTNKVTDQRLIDAFLEIERERFVPKHMRSFAYLDEDIHLGGGRYMMEPMVLARLLQIAAIEPSDHALDIGCGTGYSAAVLSRLCSTVVAVEDDPELAGRATETLDALEMDNVAVVVGTLAAGNAKQGPYDLVFFDGAIGEVPKGIVKQISEAGRVVAVIREDSGLGKGTVLSRIGAGLSGRPVFDASTPVLPGFERSAEFVF